MEELSMKNKLVVGVLAVLAVLVFATTPAHAQATRTWVSGVGDDANPCSRTAPCKTFAGAISKTAPGGEICVLDPGGFGAVTITKPISIRNDGVGTAGVLVSGTNGIIVSVPNATDNVIIRGLDFEGLGTGLSGLTVITGGNVFIEDCTFNAFTVSGINFTPTVAGSMLHVSNTYVRNNGNFGLNTGQGILISPSAAAQVDLNRVYVDRNVAGVKVTGGSVQVFESVAASNVNGGFAGASGPSILSVERSVSTHNGSGVVCNTGAVVRLGNNSITDNTAALAGTSTCSSYKNNDFDVVVTVTGINPQ
jgi:hypothetical protein